MSRQLLKQWKQKQFDPLYVFYGKEQFLIQESITFLKQQLGLQDSNWGLVLFDLDTTPIERVVEEAETAPFLSAHRLIIAMNAWFLTGNSKQGKVNHQSEQLLKYIEHPVRTSVVVLVVPSEQLDRRKKIVKQLQKQAQVVEFSSLSEQELQRWVIKRCKKQQVTMKADACQELLLLVGNDLRALQQECVKCATYVGSGGMIERDVVQRLVPRSLEQNVFQLVGKLIERKLDIVFQIWYDLLSQKEEPIRILALILRQVRLLLQVKLLREQGKPEQDIAKLLQSHPYPIKLAARQSQQYSEQELRSLLFHVLNVDQQVKTKNGDKQFAVEQLFFQLM